MLMASLLFVVFSLSAQNKYQLDVTNVQTEVKRGHLDLGGKNPAGEEISVNSFYLERNGKPFIPVIGEFHFSRYPHQYWDEELKKMKAGGISVVATYVFWNMHEFKEGTTIIRVLNGRYGAYISCNKENYKIPKGKDAKTLTLKDCQEIIANTEPSKSKSKKKK